MRWIGCDIAIQHLHKVLPTASQSARNAGRLQLMTLGPLARLGSRRSVAHALVALCILLFVGEARWLPAPFTLELEVQTQAATRLELRFDAGGGFNARDAIKLTVESPKRSKKIRFPIRAASIAGLRLVQLDGVQPLSVRHIRLKRFGGASTAISNGSVKAASNVAALSMSNGWLTISGQAGAGEMAVNLGGESTLVASRAPAVMRWVLVLLLAGAGLALVWLKVDERELRGPSRRAVITILTLAFVVACVFKLNGSSTGLWRLLSDRKSSDQSLVAGTPREIRSDEWMVQTPWMLSQLAAEPSLPLTNANVGDGPAPLLTNLPARHWSMIFRPQMWGFFFLKAERAFAIYWNFKWYALLLGAFLFLELITGGKTLLACAGALFLFASPYLQWWFSTPTCMPEMVAMLFFALWAFAMIFRARTQRGVALASIALLVALLQFVFCCYPRFQIPLAYTGAVLLACGCARGRRAVEFRAFRVVSLGVTLAVAALLVWIWWQEVGGLVRAIAALAYPGQIVSRGGDYLWVQLLAPFLEFSITESNYPAGAMNVCEAAGFLFVAPILAAVALRDVFRRRVDPLLLGCVALSIFVVVFVVKGMPLSVAQWTGWSRVYGPRAVLALGVASTVGLFRYLAARPLAAAGRPGGGLIAFTPAVLVLFVCFGATNALLGSFVSLSTVTAAAIFFALVAICIWSRRVTATCALLIWPLVLANGLTNPISHGLPGLTHNALRARVEQIHRSDPAAKWLVLGHSSRSQALTQLVKSTGASALGGLRITPDAEMLRVLDPEGKYNSVADRYAVVSFAPSRDEAPELELTFINAYTVHLPLKSGILDNLQVRYIVQVDLPEGEAGIEGFASLGEWKGCRILARTRG